MPQLTQNRRFYSFATLCALLLVPPAFANDLVNAYQQAIDNDPLLQSAAAVRESAIEARPQARSALFPQIGASANLKRTREETLSSNTSQLPPQTTYADSFGYGISLTQALFNQAAFVQLRQASDQVALAQADYLQAEQSLIVRVADRYFQLLAAEDDLRFATAEKKAIDRQLERAQRRFEVGLSAVTDVQEAQARFDLAVASEIDANRKIRSAREALREITSQVEVSPDTLSDSFSLTKPQPENPDEWVETALLNNLTLQAARLRADIAQSDIRRQEGYRYPTVEIEGLYGYNDNAEAQFGAERNSASIALNVELPIFTGGAISSQIRASRGSHNQRVAELEATRRQVERETRNAFDGVNAGISRVKALDQAVKSTQTALEATDAGFQVGARTAIEVLDAQRELLRAKRDRSKARYDYLLDSLRLKQATGQISAEDLAKLDQYLTQR